ncbi:hypothetical protein [Microbacterium sp. 2FI]|uniref:hypothetical protein n=1 Tax=Microbacterium sp. 2FI TaxID=2502193 RepID=UPI0010F4A82E|nr:hypothetical protein [Microbacterium sp. 2FI]
MTVEQASCGPVRIAWTDAAAAHPEAIAAVARLGASQRARHAGLDPARAARFAAGRLLLVRLLAEFAPIDGVALTSVCEVCGGDHGRPRVVGVPVAVSVSYTGDLVVAAAVSLDAAGAVGVDIERGDAASGPLDVLAPLFAPAPPPDLGGWTLMEAAMKADGRGVRMPMAEIRMGEKSSSVLPDGHALWLPGRAEAVEAALVAGPAGYVLSTAVIPSTAPVR